MPVFIQEPGCYYRARHTKPVLRELPRSSYLNDVFGEKCNNCSFVQVALAIYFFFLEYGLPPRAREALEACVTDRLKNCTAGFVSCAAGDAVDALVIESHIDLERSGRCHGRTIEVCLDGLLLFTSVS